jgi:ubiquinone/menaquinone biosynthesis C-methylase UbiE
MNQVQVRQAWDDIAAGYDEFVTPTHLPVSEHALRLAGLQPGMRFLDVAAGSGALSIMAARWGADVLATDISPVMVGRLRARAREEGLSNLQGRVMDGHDLDLEDNTFDLSGSQYGVMLFPDLPRALAEMVRVTKVGGRVLMVVYGPPAEVEFLGFFTRAMRAADPGFRGLPTDPPPLEFQVADPEKLHGEMARAGLQDIELETVCEELEFRSAPELWDWVTNSNPIGAEMVAGVSQGQEAVAQRTLDRMLDQRAGRNGTAVLGNLTHIAVGTK